MLDTRDQSPWSIAGRLGILGGVIAGASKLLSYWRAPHAKVLDHQIEELEQARARIQRLEERIEQIYDLTEDRVQRNRRRAHFWVGEYQKLQLFINHLVRETGYRGEVPDVPREPNFANPESDFFTEDQNIE